MRKRVKWMGLVLVTATLLFFLFQEILPLVEYKSSGVKLNEVTLEHSSSNCKIESVRSVNEQMLDGKIFILTIYKNSMNFGVTNKAYSGNDFYVNSNFFGVKGEPLAEVRVNGKVISSRTAHGGFFSTNGENATVTIDSRPNSRFISQTSFVSMKNGVIQQSGYPSRRNITTDRLLIGENRSGDIVVIHTGKFGSTTIPTMNRIAKKFGLVHAIHLDGGSSVQVKLKDGDFVHAYKALSDFGRKFTNIPEPPIHIVGNFKH